MQNSKQNNIIQPRKFANKNGEIRFNWQIQDFPRLCEFLYADAGEVKVLLRGEYDHQKRCILTAEIEAKMVLECQTSFSGIDHVVTNTVSYCTVTEQEQFVEVEEIYEPVLIEDGLLDIKQVIEDELILCVPIAANKSVDELSQKMSFGELDEVAIAEEEKVANPFSVLNNLKKT